MTELNFCPDCGAHLIGRVVAGEPRNHRYCPACEQCLYDSPQVVVTCFVAHKNRLLWVQRDLPPQRGLWAIPGGFLENSETLAEGAVRELREEAGVIIPAHRLQLYMTGTITFINQIYVAFRATVVSDAVSPGAESQDCQFFARHECPWDALAYPQVNDSIRQAYQDLDSGEFQVWQAEMTEDRYQLQPVLTRPR
jgi:8-oxo-dGTP diphosphatase